ncbi:MAG: Holliday junction resolvase RuvX [Lachnospiraceae bacterium]|nr:Holliday junction resolvase RuvX [Lachnospiraceae bacterium]
MAVNTRIMGLDFGSKTVGVALSDPLFLTAQGKEIIRREKPTKLRQTLSRIEDIIKENNVIRIVLGYPMEEDGTEGERCQKTLEFKEMLEKRTALPVDLFDERYTTVIAHRTMEETGVSKREHKEYVDEIAAMLILQSYLDREDLSRVSEGK